MLNVLFASSEVAPFAKSGGLADVAGSLPFAFDKKDVDIRIVMPKYGCIPHEYVEKMQFIKYIYVPLAWRNQYCGIFELELDGVKIYFIDNEFYFGSNNLYGYVHEDIEKFAFFSKAVLSILPDIGFKPDVIHCNDWQTGPIPFLLKAQFMDNPFYQSIKTVMTIHNLKFQGIWHKNAVSDVFGLDSSYFTNDKLEFKGDINVFKGGLVYCDKITTVSPTYAREIQTAEYGEGLDGLMRARGGDLVGILNGLSYEQYNPNTDPYIAKKYNERNLFAGKKANKQALQEKLGLEVNPDAMMIGLVSRLTNQKGLDLVSQIIGGLANKDIQLVVLGTGESHYENMFKWYAGAHPGKFSANITFDNALAHEIYAASDLFLMPSQFEPCGLSQIISLKYATIPLVRETGGLKDTITPYNEYANEGNGFSFAPYDSSDLWKVFEYAYDVFKNKKEAWKQIMRRGIKCDYSWDASAQKYLDLYRELSGKK